MSPGQTPSLPRQWESYIRNRTAAWKTSNDRAVSPFGFRFNLAVTPSLALRGVAWSLGIGLIGGLLPAVRAARVPVTVALRAT